VRLLDTLAVCYRGRRITSEGSESHRPRGAMTGAEGAVDICFGSSGHPEDGDGFG
jgi:hypothetical protein